MKLGYNMNLIQVQDRLKDMPTQAIMSYANGSNPDVPPYLALGELNRRKQMEQKQVQAPQGTVKDQIEQSVKLAQAQKAAQAQGQQKMTEAMGSQQTPVPGGTPQPQEQPEAGIAQLPTGPMNFRDGGIVSFADNPNQPASEDMPSDKEEKERRRSADRRALTAVPDYLADEILAPFRATANVVGASASGAQNFANRVINALAGTNLAENLDYNPNLKLRPLQEKRNQPLPVDLNPSKYIPEGTDRPSESAADVNAMIRGSQLGQAPSAQRPPSSGPRASSAGGGRAPGGAPQAGAPQAGGPPVAVDPLAKLMERIEGQTTQLPKSPDALREERAKTDPYLNTLPGSKLEELHAKIAQRDEEDRARFLKNEEERKQGRLNRSLMAGAEATRGRGGLGALGSFFMGYGKAGEAEDESARTRLDAQRALERQQEVLRAEVLSKVEDARIARSEGRLKDAATYEKDAAAAQNQLNQTKLTQLTSLAQAIETRRHNIATEEGQREQLKYSRMAASRGPEIQQVYEFLAKKFPDKDPAALLEMAVKNTRPGIAGDAAANTKLIGAEADIRKKYAGQKSVLTGNALAKIVALEKQEIEDLRRSAQGIGGLDASDPNAGFTVKGVK
jgi:hypothetical protein